MMLAFIWFGLFALLFVLELLLLVYWIWPQVRRKLSCPWCWQGCGIMRWYPHRWSSTICQKHEQMIRTQAAARRAHRLVARSIMVTEPSQEQEALL